MAHKSQLIQPGMALLSVNGTSVAGRNQLEVIELLASSAAAARILAFGWDSAHSTTKRSASTHQAPELLPPLPAFIPRPRGARPQSLASSTSTEIQNARSIQLGGNRESDPYSTPARRRRIIHDVASPYVMPLLVAGCNRAKR
jgi:hypothetical protein